MNEQTNNTNAAFMEVISKKIEVQDKKMLAIEEKIKDIPENTESLRHLTTKIDELRKEMPAIFPVDKLNEFGKQLDDGIHILKMPLQNKVVHHHHVPKIIWIAAGLFLSLVLVSAAWLNTYNKLDVYIANDSKYRYLKLDTANKRLQLYMYMVDSLYTADSQFNDKIVNAEEQNRRNFELLQKAYQLKSEAKNLEKMVKKNN